ncbi:MAG: nucleoid-associated protein [Chitinophagaceae bacterium]
MFDFSNIELLKLSIHKVGNKSLEEGFVLSDKMVNLETNQDLATNLIQFFLKPFKDMPAYQFTHPAEIAMNEVYKMAADMFASSRSFQSRSRDLCKLLYDLSIHPKIKSGELYVAYFSGCTWNGKATDVIGLFKSENRETFLKVEQSGNDFEISLLDGISLNKLDKGCLILNEEQESGFIVYCVDTAASANNEAQYWKQQFLNIRPMNDSYNNTSAVLKLTKQFVAGVAGDEDEGIKTLQAELLNRSMNYFDENDNFNARDYERKVFRDESMIQSFQQYGSMYVTQNDTDIAETFPISDHAVKKQSKIFKSVLKLDKNFHIYIHGNTKMIERGVDPATGKKFYKLYFDQEA